MLLRSVDLGRTVADTLVVHVSRTLMFGESGPRVLLHAPLHQKSLAAAGPDRILVEGDPGFEPRQFDAAGQLIAVFRVDARSRDAPSDALNRYVQRFPDPEEMRRIYRRMGLPDVLPAFQTLRVDHLGWSWAELFRPGEEDPSEWLVFDPEGRARGTIELPRELEIHDIGPEYILGRWVDELGVEYVVLHTVPDKDEVMKCDTPDLPYAAA